MSSASNTVVLSIDDVREVVRHVGLDVLMDEVIEALTQACRRFESSPVVTPAREGFAFGHPRDSLLEWMPAMETTGHTATIKVVGYYPTNPELHRLPTILSTAYTYSTDTGHLKCVADGTFITALRTGAASAVASRILASPRATTLGLVGCGAQAIAQLHGLTRVFDLERVLIYDPDVGALGSFRERAAPLNLDVEIAASTCPDLVREADIICTATSVGVGCGPVIADLDLKPWVHVNAVGSDFPGKIELPVSLLVRSLVCSDFLPQALKEGECQQLSADQIGPDLVALVVGADKYASAREAPTVFDSTGWALEDHVALGILVEYAHQLHLGTRVQLEGMSVDPKNPYGFLSDRPPRMDKGRDPMPVRGVTAP